MAGSIKAAQKRKHSIHELVNNMSDIKVIWDRRVAALADLQSAIKLLEQDLKTLKGKIASQGVDGYYSANSDVLRHAQSIWRSCRQLQLLRELQSDEDALNSYRDDIEKSSAEEQKPESPSTQSDESA